MHTAPIASGSTSSLSRSAKLACGGTKKIAASSIVATIVTA